MKNIGLDKDTLFRMLESSILDSFRENMFGVEDTELAPNDGLGTATFRLTERTSL